MKTYIVTEAHKTNVVFEGKRTEVKRFIKNHYKTWKTDPLYWDVLCLLSNGVASYGRTWGEDFIQPYFKLS